MTSWITFLFLVTAAMAFFRHPAASPVAPSVTLMAVGDVMLGRAVNARSVRMGDFTYPFIHVSDYLSSADLVLINLESPIVPDCPVVTDGMKFCSPPGSVAGLTAAHVALANLANNHTLNYGPAGLASTAGLLNQAGISPLGLGHPVIRQVAATRIGFLGYNHVGAPQSGIAWADPKTLASDIAALRPQVDHLVVSFHWGLEYTSAPTSHQVSLAHVAVDAGADAVLGHHPHWTQTVEHYSGKPIVYSLGNFVFDQTWSDRTRRGHIALLTFSSSKSPQLTLTPVYINSTFQPTLE